MVAQSVKKLLVLIVDDNGDNRAIAARHLADLGYNMIEAEDGISGIRKMIKQKDHLAAALWDWMMPDMSGIEIFQEMQEYPEVRDIPFVIVSARTDSESRRQAMGAGVTHFLGKPFNQRQLQQILEAAIAAKEKVL